MPPSAAGPSLAIAICLQIQTRQLCAGHPTSRPASFLWRSQRGPPSSPARLLMLRPRLNAGVWTLWRPGPDSLSCSWVKGHAFGAQKPHLGSPAHPAPRASPNPTACLAVPSASAAPQGQGLEAQLSPGWLSSTLEKKPNCVMCHHHSRSLEPGINFK